MIISLAFIEQRHSLNHLIIITWKMPENSHSVNEALDIPKEMNNVSHCSPWFSDASCFQSRTTSRWSPINATLLWKPILSSIDSWMSRIHITAHDACPHPRNHPGLYRSAEPKTTISIWAHAQGFIIVVFHQSKSGPSSSNPISQSHPSEFTT